MRRLTPLILILKRSIFAALAGILLSSSACALEDPEVGDDDDPLYVHGDRIWLSSTIPVCFENPNATSATIRGWIEAAAYTWESVSKVRFTGWGGCTSASKGLRIILADADPQTSGLGNALDGVAGGVRLNPFFVNNRANCGNDVGHVDADGRFWTSMRKYCLSVHTVHEFGHALGFSHEQNRSDTPQPAPTPKPDCAGDAQGGDGTVFFGAWDPWSVMVQSYCSVSSTGHLTPTDIAGVQTYYGRETNDQLWLVDGNMQEIRGDYSTAAALSVSHYTQKISGHYRAFTGDFDGDDVDDIFWYRPGSGSGNTENLWWGNPGGSFYKQNNAHNVDGDYLPLAGDFDGDGADDIFWFKAGTGADVMWWSDGDRSFTSSFAHSVNGTTYKPLVGDFNGDQTDDIFWYSPGSGKDVMWWSDGDRSFTTSFSIQVSASGTRPLVGDFDGDGDSDIFWYRPGSGSDVMWWSDGLWRKFRSSWAFSVNGDHEVAVGDFDGNGTDDIFWNSASFSNDSVWFWKLGKKAYVDAPSALRGSYIPLVGDFSDDGISDIFWYGG